MATRREENAAFDVAITRGYLQTSNHSGFDYAKDWEFIGDDSDGKTLIFRCIDNRQLLRVPKIAGNSK